MSPMSYIQVITAGSRERKLGMKSPVIPIQIVLQLPETDANSEQYSLFLESRII